MKQFIQISKISLLVAILFCTIGFTKAQTQDAVFSSVESAISKSDAAGLSNYFNTSVEVTVPGADQTYSANQAQFVIKEFFTKHPVKAFKLLHKGESGGTNYATGTLTCSNGTFDTNIFIKKIGDKFLITQIRFEED